MYIIYEIKYKNLYVRNSELTRGGVRIFSYLNDAIETRANEMITMIRECSNIRNLF